MHLAPIILFVYNRPWHTQQTLEALMQNALADQSTLYIYCDGPKEQATEDEKQNIIKVRELIKKKLWCEEVFIIERNTNLGLANSVIQGVSEVIERHQRVIVLEDDILTGKYFLQFMNEGLNLYEDDKKVFGVSGHQFPSAKRIKDSTYFLPIMSSWGYGTWMDRWMEIEFDGKRLLEVIEDNKIGSQLDFGVIQYYQMLKDQVTGKNNSWAVRFQVSMFLKKGFFLYPNKKLIHNIGLDGSGVHCKKIDDDARSINDISKKSVSIHKLAIELKENFVNDFKNIKAVKKGMTFKSKFLSVLPPEIKLLLKRKFKKASSQTFTEFDRLKKVPRYTKTSAIIDGYELQIPDSASFLFMYDEIFRTQIYKFKTQNPTPYIIDGGANIGLSTLYFKKLYPKAVIVAFEPDPDIYAVLQENIANHSLEFVNLVHKGLWNHETSLTFKVEGADAGLLVAAGNEEGINIKTVPVTSLNPYLQKTVDFLKLDIEGAETVVLKDIEDNLDKVERIFVEYHSFVEEEQSLNEILNILKKAKFRVYMSIPGNNSIKSPFMGLRAYNNMDFQLNIFGFKQDCS